MAKEYIELEPGNEYGVISLNKTVFSTIAKNVIEELKLVYNKTRQAAITKELSEICGGAAAV